VDHVQISLPSRWELAAGRVYEQAGVIRDVFQNHLLQLLALTAMEAPVAFNADAVRDEKVKIFRSLRLCRDKDAITNTYAHNMSPGQWMAGGFQAIKTKPAYLQLSHRKPTWLYDYLSITGGGQGTVLPEVGKRLQNVLPRYPIHFGQVLCLFSAGGIWQATLKYPDH